MSLFVISQLQQLEFDPVLQQLVHKQKKANKGAFDFAPFVVGVFTLLKQFHSLLVQAFLSYLGQYIRTICNGMGGEKSGKSLAEYPPNVVNVLLFLESFCDYGGIARRVVEQYVPSWYFDTFSKKDEKK